MLVIGYYVPRNLNINAAGNFRIVGAVILELIKREKNENRFCFLRRERE